MIGASSSAATSNSYAVGPLTAGTNVTAGGLTATPSIGTTTDSYWDTDTTGIADDTPAISPKGRRTRELQQGNYTNAYTGWDSDPNPTGSDSDPWDFGTKYEYPVLKYGSQDPIKQGRQARGHADNGNNPVAERTDLGFPPKERELNQRHNGFPS